MSPLVTVMVNDCSHSRLRELERFVGHCLYRKGTDAHWFVDFRDREMADMVVVNLNADGFHAHIMGDPQ